MFTARGICLNWSSRSMVNCYLLLFRSLELSLNLTLDFSGELILFSAFFNFCFILCHFRWILSLTLWVICSSQNKVTKGAIFMLSNSCIGAFISKSSFFFFPQCLLEVTEKCTLFPKNSTKPILNHIYGPKVAMKYEPLRKKYFYLCELRNNHSCDVQYGMAVFRAE